jgi:hypothetical protein
VSRARTASALALVLFWLPACGHEREEAQKVAAMIDRMRDLPAAEREPLLGELEKMTIDGEMARAARDACAPVYRALMEANVALDETQARLDAKKKAGGAPSSEDIAKLGEGMKKVTVASRGSTGCAEAVAKLKQTIR